MHVDEFMGDYGSDEYAGYFLMMKRLPAALQCKFRGQTKDLKLFCDYEGKRYRCTGASRLGDIWLTSNFKQDIGYELRVDVEKCSGFSRQE